MYTQKTKNKLLSLLEIAANSDRMYEGLAAIEEATEICHDFANACDDNNWDVYSLRDLDPMIDWVKNMSVEPTPDEAKQEISKKLKQALILAHSLGVDFVSYPKRTFEDEYLLSNDDKDFVIFHKEGTDPDIIDKVDVNKQPKSISIWKDWIMTVTYHS
ncbi:MAG: hypothetical protein IT263_12735 [Saprospiraceae bacterium]|nr:hypothetical protein [Saprospiraceae bacterium]